MQYRLCGVEMTSKQPIGRVRPRGPNQGGRKNGELTYLQYYSCTCYTAVRSTMHAYATATVCTYYFRKYINIISTQVPLNTIEHTAVPNGNTYQIARHRSAPNFSKEPHVLARGRSCHNPYFHDHGFIEIGAGFIVHGFSMFPARRFFNNGLSYWIQFKRRTSENHYVFTRTKKTVLQFYSVKWNIFDSREIIDNLL
jgi:hypothetical protein